MKKLIITLAVLLVPLSLMAGGVSMSGVSLLSGSEEGGEEAESEYILGYNTGDLGTNYGSSSYIRGTPFTTDSTGGTLTKFGVTIGAYSGAPHGIKMAIYPTVAGDPSGQTLLESVTGTITGTGELLIDAAGTTHLNGSTTYYICVEVIDTDDKYTFGSSALTSYGKDGTVYADFPPATFPASADAEASRTWGVWCVYTH